jgi:hypothetical protein
MTYEAAILYAKQRMREIGKLPFQYHWEPVRIVGTEPELAAGLISIKAYNELYILIYPNKYYGVFILSDNSAFNSDAIYQSGVPEFTGQIFIKKIKDDWCLERAASPPSKLRPIPIEFLRVVIY